MLTLLTQSIDERLLRHLFPALHRHDLRAPLGADLAISRSCIGYVGAAATKSIILGLIILATAVFFVPLRIEHPFWMLLFLVLTAVTFSLFGFIIGIWADGFEKLQIVPLLIITPLTFLGGTFYSIHVLPPLLAEGDAVQSGRLSGQRLPLELLRHGRCQRGREPRHDAAVSSASASAIVWWIFKTGYRLKS